MKLGTVGVNLGNVEAYRVALKGLSVEQSVFALASKGATEEQIRQILVTNQATAEDVEAAMAKAGLTTATQALNAEELIALATKKGISAERAKEIASALGLIATEKGQVVSKKQLTVATLQQVGATDAEITAILGLNAAETTNIGITNVLTASFAKLWAVITAHPIGAILTAIGVVAVSAVAAYNKWGDTLENTKEKLSDLKSECQEIVSDLQAVNSELETTQQRLEELEGKDTLTFTEKEEYDNLVKINNELQRKIDLLELEEKNKRKEQNKTFVSVMKKDTEDPFEHEVNPDGKKPVGQYSISDEYLTSETGYIEAQFEIRDQLLEDLANAETEKEKERIQKRIDEINSYLEDKNTEWETVSDGIDYIENPTTEDDKAVNEWLDYIADFQDRMAIAMSKDDASSNAKYKTNTFNRVVDNWQFDETVQGLQDLGKEGKVTAEMLNDPKYDEFINKLVFLGVIDSADNLEDVALAFNSIATSAENAADSASQYGDEITVSSLSEYLNQDNDDIAKIKEDLLELARSGEITEDTFNSTKEYRAILSELGLTSEEAYRQLMQMTDLEMDLSDWQTQISNARSSISELQDFVKEINKDGLSSSSIDKIVTDYPQLLKYLDDTPTLLSEINRLIEEQSDVAQNAGNMLVEYNSDAYDQIKSTAQSAFNKIEILQNGQIKSLADMYGIDLDNYSSLAQAKKEIEFALLGSLNEGWASHFGIVIDSLTGFATATENLGEYYNNKENQEKVAQYNQLISKLNKAKEQFEGKINYGDVGVSSSSSDKDTSKDINWIEPLLENIENRISRLRKVSDSAYSTFAEKNQALADQIHLVNEEIQLQQQAYEGYMEKANSIGLSDDYKKLVQEGAINIEKITDKELQEAISNYSEWYEKAKETQDKITDLHEQSKDLRVEAADNGANELKELLDHQAITEREYIDRMNDLWEFYYANQVELAEVAKDRKLELLEEEKDYLESVAEAASSILDYEIDELEEQKENAIKPYQDQIEVLEDKKKALEDYLDDLEDERKREELILNLQKAQYELEKAKSQRNKLMYQDGQMTYVADDKSIRDAREQVDDAQFELTKFNIEQQIEAYDEQIDKLNELIEQTEKYYDDQIEGLEKTKNEWEKMIELQERAMNITLFESMFGKGSVANLLAGDMSQIATWQKEFVDTLAEIDLTANGQIGEFTKQYADLANIDLSGLSEQTTTVASQFDALKESVDGATSAIAGTSGGGETKEGESTNGEEGSNGEGESASANSLVGAIDASYQTASETLPAEAEMMNGLTESTTVAMTEVNSLGEAINALPDEKTITINVVTNGSVGGVGGAGASGTAHAEGTAKVTGDWGVHQGGKTLVGELGQEIVVRNGRFFTVGDNGAEFVDLQKGDIVFNHLQSKELLSKGNIVGRGNALSEGTVLQKATTPSYLRPIQEGDKGYELIKAARVYQDMLKTNIMLPVNSIDKNVEMMARNISNVNTSNVNKPTLTINGGINVTCPAVNSKEIMNQVSTALHREIGGIALEALQEASITR